MTDQQIFQLFGLAFTATGIGMLSNPANVKTLLDELEKSSLDLYLSGFISLTVGFLLVSFHNSWVFNPSLIITLIGWAGLLKGLSILIVPNFTIKLSERIVDNDVYLSVFAGFSVVLGLVSLYLGFLA